MQFPDSQSYVKVMTKLMVLRPVEVHVHNFIVKLQGVSVLIRKEVCGTIIPLYTYRF